MIQAVNHSFHLWPLAALQQALRYTGVYAAISHNMLR